jgi:hypothetical protein
MLGIYVGLYMWSRSFPSRLEFVACKKSLSKRSVQRITTCLNRKAVEVSMWNLRYYTCPRCTVLRE